jgi:hypothetical protein
MFAAKPHEAEQELPEGIREPWNVNGEWRRPMATGDAREPSALQFSIERTVIQASSTATARAAFSSPGEWSLGGNRSNARNAYDLPLRRIEEIARFHLRSRGVWCVKRRVEFPRSVGQRDSE